MTGIGLIITARFASPVLRSGSPVLERIFFDTILGERFVLHVG
jgi:hypothetical protein